MRIYKNIWAIALVTMFAFAACQESPEVTETMESAALQSETAILDVATTEEVTEYEVRFVLIDNYGREVSTESSGLMGYWAYDLEGEFYIYQDRRDTDDTMHDIPQGTYKFGAYDGYFSGSGTTTLTLSPELIGEDGFVEVVLSYWSE